MCVVTGAPATAGTVDSLVQKRSGGPIIVRAPGSVAGAAHLRDRAMDMTFWLHQTE